MVFQREELCCPKCKGENLDPVPYIYQTLRSRGAGRRVFAVDEIVEDPDELSQEERERLIRRLTPPTEPKKSLPAGAIAIMAFVLSWLITGSLLIGRIGQKLYFTLSLIIIIGTSYPFFYILNYVDREFRKSVAKYNRLKPVWNKQYICHDCQHIFIPPKAVRPGGR